MINFSTSLGSLVMSYSFLKFHEGSKLSFSTPVFSKLIVFFPKIIYPMQYPSGFVSLKPVPFYILDAEIIFTANLPFIIYYYC